MKLKYFCTYIALLPFQFAICQFTDSLKVAFGTTASIAKEEFLPLWLVSNRWGVVYDKMGDVTAHFHLSNINYLKKQSDLDTSEKSNYKRFYVRYGLDVYANDALKNFFFEQAFVKAGFKNLEIRVGRFEEKIGVVDADLSSGSFGVSSNALPIPKVGISVTNFTNVPFTKGWVQFKGTFSHGWLGKNNYLKDAFLHEKSFYLRFGASRFRFIIGGQHYAEWGGQRPEIKLNRSLKSFFDVIFVKWANDGSFNDPNTSLSISGDHRACVEGAAQWFGNGFTINVYQQTPFESNTGFSFKNKDALRGASIEFNKKHGLTKILAEYISTKQMFDFVPIGYRETYYNNWAYKTGWEYNNRIIGTPLFINRQRGSKYFSSIQPYNWDAPADSVPGNGNIINNRIRSVHLGASGVFFNDIKTRALFTYTKNFGTYYDGPFKDAPKKQYYSMVEASLPIYITKINVTAAVGFDWGDLATNVGLLLSVMWKLK